MRNKLSLQFATGLVVALLYLVGSPCYAQLKDPSELFMVTVDVKGKDVEMYCDRETLKSGRGKERGTRIKLTFWSKLVKKFKSRDNKKKAKQFRQYNKFGNQECANGDPGTDPSPSPSPSASPSGNTNNFENDGTCTDVGKTNFGIPTNLEADRSTGQTLAQTYGCDDCHAERTNGSFTYYRIEIAKEPMNYTSAEISDSQLAHLTCYLNRFQLP